MTNIVISETDNDHDPLTASMSKLTMVDVSIKSTFKSPGNVTDIIQDLKRESDVIDLTLDSDSGHDDDGFEYRCFKSDQLSEAFLAIVRTEEYPKNQSFKDFVQIYLDNIPISSTLLSTLVQSNSWLNDEMINAFFRLLGAAYPKSLFLNTFFFTNLVSGVDVYGWIRKATGRKSLFEYDHLFFPINHGNTHWSLGVLCIKDMELMHFDSLGSSMSKIRRAHSKLIIILEKEAKENYLSRIDDIGVPLFRTLKELNVSVKRGQSPRQADGSSCGVHTCYTAHRIAKKETLYFTASQVTEYRKKMAGNFVLLSNQAI